MKQQTQDLTPDRSGWVRAVVGLAIIAFLAFYLMLVVLWFPGTDGWDVLMRYAPMADAFAAGDMNGAFHPRFCFLFQVLTGSCAWLLGISGLKACQIVAMIFWILSIVPLFELTRRMFDVRSALISVALLMCSTEFFELAGNGWREDIRTFAVLCLVLGLCMMIFPKFDKDERQSSWYMALGLFFSIGLRVDCFPIATVTLMIYGIVVLIRREGRCLWIPALAWMLPTIVNCSVVWFYDGWFLPAPHYIRIFGGTL